MKHEIILKKSSSHESTNCSSGGCYDTLFEISLIDGIISSPQSPPPGCSRFYEGGPTTHKFCEEKCEETETCEVYTYFSKNHPESIWEGECLVCAANVVGENRVPNEYATSGIKRDCDGIGK